MCSQGGLLWGGAPGGTSTLGEVSALGVSVSGGCLLLGVSAPRSV